MVRSSTRNNVATFLIAVAALMLLRNMVYLVTSEAEVVKEDRKREIDPRTPASPLSSPSSPPSTSTSPKPKAEPSASTVTSIIRQFSEPSKTVPVVVNPLTASSTVKVVLNRTIENREKSDKNHTLLKANMSHVGEIVKKLQDTPQKDAYVVNPHDFKYLINTPDLCGKDEVFMLIYIHTAPDHHKRRMVIRRTWGKLSQYQIPIRMIFVMGVTKLSKNATDSQSDKALLFESEQYGDIVQEEFLDTYHNLTYKGIAALKWISIYCSQATFVLKTDDDIFVNTFTLLKYLTKLNAKPESRQGVLMCAVWYGMQVMRTGKWKVTKEEWADDSYPTYCSGSAFILSTDVALRLHNVSYSVPFFWVDDFYITGLLPLRAGNITHRQFLSTFVLNGDRLEEMFTGPQWYSYIFSHVHNLNRIQAVWDTLTQLVSGKKPAPIKKVDAGHPSLSKNDPQDAKL